ncbi:c-Myc-binding protein-like isoform X2 [Corythoichthys intestinalis]|uniref:c-Myc-binding protein-like isoform X2 n=1 Tax=Corythoichthys intestinalis TaxID=161448 RepID=UPI0025A61EFE|nr:c-Myc-binding protein-like isoform X2 [Corythoichthys intestinalis]XP_061808777.1 c-Myc-binding protein-like [Nerophis lumbriciformis]
MAYKKDSLLWKREDFKRYLEKTGVLDTLTNAMTALYREDEKPDNALDFLKRQIIAQENEVLVSEKAELQQKFQLLTEENQQLKSKLMLYEPSAQSVM